MFAEKFPSDIISIAWVKTSLFSKEKKYVFLPFNTHLVYAEYELQRAPAIMVDIPTQTSGEVWLNRHWFSLTFPLSILQGPLHYKLTTWANIHMLIYIAFSETSISEVLTS